MKYSAKSHQRSLQLYRPLSLLTATLLISTPAYAQMNESLVMAYAQSMQAAANAQNISQIARLVSDEAVIALTRQGKGSSTLDKSTYLDLLQKSWTQAQNYHYQMTVSDVVITGDQARAVVITTETWTKDGQPHKLTTTARATLGSNGRNAILLRSVAQVAVE